MITYLSGTIMLETLSWLVALVIKMFIILCLKKIPLWCVGLMAL